MAFVKLTGGYYQSRSIPAAAQRCVNLYQEPTPPQQGEPVSFWDYATPGLKFIGKAPEEICRCLYRASNGDLYGVYGNSLYYIDYLGAFTPIGVFVGSHLTDVVPRITPVSIADNGINLLIVMNTLDGWTVDMATRGSFTRINVDLTNTVVLSATPGKSGGTNYSVGDSLTLNATGGAIMTVLTVDAAGAVLTQEVVDGGNVPAESTDPVGVTGGTGKDANFILQYEVGSPNAGFTGGSYVTYQDGVFILNSLEVDGTPTNVFYVSKLNSIEFSDSQFDSKNAYPDAIQAVVSCHRVLWLIGEFSYEVWYPSGGSGSILNSFPFSLIPSAFGNYGAMALYSIQAADNEVYFLSHDATGKAIMLQGQSDYSTKRISTHSMEAEWATYPRLNDAYASIHQMNGHSWYMITFPSANNERGKTWCYDATTQIWHERTFTDSNGLEWRHRAAGNSVVEAYGSVWVGDWATNYLYQFDLDTYHDYGFPIVRKRTFQHAVDVEGQRRASFRQLSLFMETGTSNQAEQIDIPLTVCSFNAPDGTALQAYHNPSDLGATFTKVSGTTNAVINANVLVAQATGEFLYSDDAVPFVPDYSITYVYRQNDYTLVPIGGSEFYVTGRANGSNLGYKLIISSDGSQLDLTLDGITTPVTIALGTLASGYYQINLTMIQSSITASVYRSQDGMWLASDASWVSTQTTAISVTDTNFSAPGIVELGGASV